MLYFLYFSWMALICGCSFCIFSADFMLEMRKRQQRQVDDDRLDDDRPAPVGSDVIVRPLEPQEQRARDHAEEAEIDSGRARSGPPGSPVSVLAWTDSRTSSDLGPTNRRSRVTPSKIADGRSQNFHLDQFLGSGLRGLAEPRCCCRKVTMAACWARRAGRPRRNTGPAVRPSERARQSVAAADFLDASVRPCRRTGSSMRPPA